ncbi:MAG TPA: cyclodeaminase/cyclohydrolase family protein, partial [Thermoanaerobaculia bacterium]
GSVAALLGALGAALGAMVGWLTYGRRKYEHLEPHLRAHIPPLVRIQEELIQAVDRDSAAFEDYMTALGMAKGTPEEAEARRAAMQEGLTKATRVPLRTMELADEAWEPLLEIARYGQYSSRSDVEVGAKALEAAIYGACRNVVINLGGIQDPAFRDELQQRADALLARASEMGQQVRAVIDGRAGDA